MAVKFLTNLDLNGNQLLNARLQVLASDPGTALAGDIIYNSSNNVFKFYNGSDWIDPSQDSQGMVNWLLGADSGTTDTITNGDQVGFTGGTGILTTISAGAYDAGVSIALNNTAVTAGSYTTADITVDAQGRITSASSGTSGDTYTIGTSNPASGVVSVILDASTGNDSSFAVLEANLTSVEVSRDGAGNIKLGLKNNVTIPGDLTVAGGDIILSGTGRIQGVDTVTASTDAASKSYVDNSIVGGFTVKGGFNANTGITAVAGTNLYTNTAVAVGDYYIVTNGGNFFGNTATPLTVGDSVLAQTAAASGNVNESDFAVIQSDTDLATLTTVGIGNVNEGIFPNKFGIDVGYSSGTANVGLDINGLSSYQTSFSYPDDDELVIYATDDGSGGDQNMKISLTNLKSVLGVKGSFSGTSTMSTSHVFTHNLGTYNVVVQLFDTSTKETVYASVDRNSTSAVTVTTASTASLTCLIQEV